MGGYGNQMMGGYPQMQQASPLGAGVNVAQNPANRDRTDRRFPGQRGARRADAIGAHMPHVIPNPFDNTILIQGTPQEYEQILGLLRQLDIPPRQVLIDAKIYEVDLNGAFAAGVTAYLEKKDTGTVLPRSERGYGRGRHRTDHGRAGAAQPRTAGRDDGIGDQGVTRG